MSGELSLQLSLLYIKMSIKQCLKWALSFFVVVFWVSSVIYAYLLL